MKDANLPIMHLNQQLLVITVSLPTIIFLQQMLILSVWCDVTYLHGFLWM